MIGGIYRESRMRLYLNRLVFIAVFSSYGSASAQQGAISSMYTDIGDKACAGRIDDAATGARTLDCPGVSGFRLQVLEDDERSSVSIVAPDGRVFPLNYWDVVTRGFSALGSRVEWRVAKLGRNALPVALIVPVIAFDHSGPGHPKRVPLLAVARVARDAACVVRVVDARVPGANKQARQIAADGGIACLSDSPNVKPITKG